MRTSAYISVFLLLTGVSTSYVIVSWDAATFPTADKASSIISLWACVAAFISAAYVIQSYLQTNRAFLLSQKPHLRIWVNNIKKKKSAEDPTLLHVTCINYENMTLNPFHDLTIHVRVSNSLAAADLSDLFTPKMFMAGRDQRQRSFVTHDEILRHGLEMESASIVKDPPKFSIQYEFTFDAQIEEITIQQYVWDVKVGEWQIV